MQCRGIEPGSPAQTGADFFSLGDALNRSATETGFGRIVIVPFIYFCRKANVFCAQLEHSVRPPLSLRGGRPYLDIIYLAPFFTKKS